MVQNTTDRPVELKVGRPTPGPRGHLLLGSLPDFRRDPIQALLSAWRTYGDVVQFRLGGRYRVFLLAHPDQIKYVLQDANQRYPKHPFNIGKLKATLGEGLLTSEGSFWLRQRRLIQPAFHRQRLAALGSVMTDATVEQLAGWDDWAERGQPIDVASEMMHLTLAIVAKAMFGADVRADVAAVEAAVSVTLADTMRRTQSLVELPRWLPLAVNRRFLAALSTLNRIVYRIIEERRQHPEDRGDLVSMLLQAQDADTGERMTDRQVRDEAMTIFLAGHETTSNALTWTFYLLSQNPGAARRLRVELSAVLGGRVPTVEDLPSLPFNRQVIDESMRLYPPAWILSRMPIADDVLGGYRIPAGSNLFLSPYVTHRHPAFWEDPERFDPDRFTPERVAARPRFAYFPFGGGPRMCIGNNFALLEAQLLLATIAQRYELLLVPGHQVGLLPQVTLRPRGGMPMFVSQST
jgi:cytochrome P450